MPRIVPSQVCDYITRVFPNEDSRRVHSGNAHMLAVLLNLIDAIPDELIQLDIAEFSEFRVSVASIRHQVEMWKTNPSPSLMGLPGVGKIDNPITSVDRCLKQCPDETPSPAAQELLFITDPSLRDSLRIDISATNRALHNGEWKAATVLAGSVIEALLLWALLQQSPAAVTGAASMLKLKDAPLDWHLPQYIRVAEHLKIIESATVTAASLAKDFRNLIHPGRAQRTGQTCNRGTAMSAVAALELVVEDLR
jgi:hypothetical protein